MVIYIYLYLICTVSCLFYKIHRKSWVYFILLVFPMILIMGLRGEGVGIDTAQYIRNFERIETKNIIYDPLYTILSLIIHKLGFNITVLFVVMAIITVLPILWVVRRKSVSLVLSICLLFSLGYYLHFFNIMRQGAAVSLVLFSFYFKDKSNKSWIIIYLSSILMHLSAIVFLPFFFIKFKNILKVYLLLLWLLSLYFAFSSSLLLQLMHELALIVPDQYHYFLIGDQYIEKNSAFRIGFLLPQFIFLLVFYVYIMEKSYNVSSFVRQSLVYTLIGIVLRNFLWSAIFFSRISIYFDVFSIIAIPFAINYIFKGWSRVSIYMLVYAALFLLFIYRLNIDPYGIVPYKFGYS